MADSTNRAVSGAVDDAVDKAATRNVRRVVVDAAPRANHPALQDFLKGVELQ
jgi:hypothetical protein